MRVEAEVRFTSWHIYSLIYTINISKGGMHLELPEEPKVGSALDIKLTAPDGKVLKLSAIVRHAQKSGARWGVGVQFQDLDATKRETIEKAIRAHGGTLQAQGLTPRK